MKKKRVKKDKKKKGKDKKKDKQGSGGGEKPSGEKEKPTGGGAPPSSSKWKHGDWSCQKCGAHNFRGKDSCFRCKYARANSVKAASAESALAYLTKRASGAEKELDSVQHLWLGKSSYTKDVNDATFDLYATKYVNSLDNKHKLHILKRACLAAERAERLIKALENTPEEEAKNPNKARKRGKKKKAAKEGARAEGQVKDTKPAKETKKAEDTKETKTTKKVEKVKDAKSGKKDEKVKETKKEENIKAKETSKKEEKTKTTLTKTPAKRKAPPVEASLARVTRSRAAKK